MRLLAALLLGIVALSDAGARARHLWTSEELTAISDVVVVARPGITRPDDDRLPDLIGVDTDFQTAWIVKGPPDLKKFVVHHYAIDRKSPPNGPITLVFPEEKWTLGTMYRLYLVRHADGRYRFATGTMDPDLSVVVVPEG